MGDQQKSNGFFQSRYAAVGGVLSASALLLLAMQSLPLPTKVATSNNKVSTPSAEVPNHKSLIVKTKGALTAKNIAALESIGAKVTAQLPIISSVAIELPAKNADKISKLQFVQHVSPDDMVTKCDEFVVKASGVEVAWAAPYNLTGKGIGVAIIDSGIDNVTDVTNRTKGQNFVPDNTGVVTPTSLGDGCGHGTHVAGIVAGNGSKSSASNNFRTFLGVAKNANVVAVRVLDRQGSSTVSRVIQGIQWCVNNRIANNIRVINMSLGHSVGESYTTDPLCQAAEAAWKAGIVVVCAAGNTGRLNPTNTAGLDNEGWGTAYGSVQSPANDPYVITVGAMKPKAMHNKTSATDLFTYDRSKDTVATYSSRGPSRLDYVMKPDIMAPGNKVVSMFGNNTNKLAEFPGNIVTAAFYTTTNKGQSGKTSQDYFVLSGTSMAAPVVTGAVALMLEATPSLSPDSVKARLMLSADKWTMPDGTDNPCTLGAGYLNIPAALKSIAITRGYAVSPNLIATPDGNVSFDSNGNFWCLDVNGYRAVWGVNGVGDLRAVWGNRAMWGTSTYILDASRAMWGSSVWGDRAMWGSSTSAVDLTNTAVNGE